MHWRMLRLKRKQPCLHERRASSPQCLHGCRNLSQFPNSSNKDTQHPASEPRDRWQVNHDIERERERERESEDREIERAKERERNRVRWSTFDKVFYMMLICPQQHRHDCRVPYEFTQKTVARRFTMKQTTST